MLTSVEARGIHNFTGKSDYSEGTIPGSFIIHLISPQNIVDVCVTDEDKKTTQATIDKFKDRYNNGKRTVMDSMLNWYSEYFGGVATPGKLIVYPDKNDKSKILEVSLPLVPSLSRWFRDEKFQPEILKYIDKAVDRAYSLGAKLTGLGGFNSVASLGGKTLFDNHPLIKSGEMCVDNGNALTAGIAYKGLIKLMDDLCINIETTNISIIGATGSIGRVFSRMLSKINKGKLHLIANTESELKKMKRDLGNYHPNIEAIGKDNIERKKALHLSDICVIVSSAVNFQDLGVSIEDFKPGSVILDVGRPRTVPENIIELRPDIFATEGGVIDFPSELGEIIPSGILGMGHKKIFACLGELILLCLEGRKENFSVGTIQEDKVWEILKISEKWGFELSGYRMFDRPIPDERLVEVKRIRCELASI
jgi:predicted amino acid dehydrogenase